MRPIQLTMSAFGPYAKETVIPMERLGREGLYLICGDTGAGKTTIFDAIVYALYGEASGSDRNAKLFRSEYAAEDTPTFVELIFQYGEKTYQVRRNPAYQRQKSRGKGTTLESAKAELTLPDGRVITRNNEVDAKIREILGVDRVQFSQIAMIAQGEFLKLLRAETKDRKEIFSGIFKTGRYGTLQERLKVKRGEAEETYRQQVARIQDDIRRVVCNEEDAAQFAWQQVLEGRHTTQETLALLEQLLTQDEQKKAALTAEIAENDCKARELVIQIEGAKEQEQLKKRLLQARQEVKQAEERLQQLSEQQEKAKERQPEADALGRQIILETNQLPQYEELDRNVAIWRQQEKALTEKATTHEQLAARIQMLEQAVGQHKQELSALSDAGEQLLAAQVAQERLVQQKKELQLLLSKCCAYQQHQSERTDFAQKRQRAEETLHTHQAYLTQLRLEATQLQDVESELVRLQNQLTALTERSAELLELGRQLDRYRKSTLQLKRTQQSFQNCQHEADRAAARYQLLNRQYLQEQAGVLALQLKEGEPCPVCGGLHHPTPACMSTSAPTELEVQQAESNSKRTEQAARQASEAAARDLATVGAQQDELLRQMERLSFSCDESQLETALLQENKRLQGAQAAGKEQLNQAVVRQRRQKQLQSALIPQAEQREQTLLQTLTEAKEREAQLSYRCEQEQETLQQEFQRLLPTIKQCKDSLLVNTAEAAVADLSHHLAQAERAVSIQQARVDRKAALEQAIPPLEEEQKNAARELETLRVEIVTAQGECAHLKQTTEALRKGLPYPSRAAAETALLRLRKQKLNIEQGIAAAESQCAEQAAALNRAHGVVKSLQGQLAAAPQYDLPLLQTKERELLEQQTAQRQALLAVEQRLHTNRGCYQRIGETAATVQQAERNLQNLEALSNTASGKVNGKEKIELETYVQMAYFDRIVRRANYRLLVMSGGQYELVRREKGENGKKQTGLDLDVIDHYYGNNSTSRNVSTLSGGESFLASLSLALGLSDEVLHSSNGIQLDTLFVDEGFGSLDEETLQQAMTALLKMTEGGRLVGIISHVGELKNSIPRQIVVKKEKSGGSQATIVV